MELCLYIVPRIFVEVALAVTTQDGTFFIAVVAPCRYQVFYCILLPRKQARSKVKRLQVLFLLKILSIFINQPLP